MKETDIGNKVHDDLLNAIDKLPTSDWTTRRNLRELMVPEEMKPILKLKDQILLESSIEVQMSELIEPQHLEPIGRYLNWLIALHWLIRHWKSNHKIPNYKVTPFKNPNGKKNESIYMGEAVKPLGDVLRSIVRILNHVHPNTQNYNTENIHYMDIFVSIAWEIYDLHFYAPDSGGKEAKAKEISSYATSLKNNRNGIDPELYPNLHNFTKMVVSESKRDIQSWDEANDFKQRFLLKRDPEQKGLIEAFRALSSSFRKTNRYVSTESTNNAYIVNIGSGKGQLTISREDVKNFFLKPLLHKASSR
jgi:hypothetical protein